MLIIFGKIFREIRKVESELPLLIGIGKSRAQIICRELGFSPNLKVKDLSFEQQIELTKKIKTEYIVDIKLQDEIKTNIQRYINNGCYRGIRHKDKLPVRGQRTHSNAQTSRKIANLRNF